MKGKLSPESSEDVEQLKAELAKLRAEWRAAPRALRRGLMVLALLLLAWMLGFCSGSGSREPGPRLSPLMIETMRLYGADPARDADRWSRVLTAVTADTDVTREATLGCMADLQRQTNMTMRFPEVSALCVTGLMTLR